MGSKDSEDLMNLGPFMATYVMGNPFGGLQLEDDSPPEPPPPPAKKAPAAATTPPPPLRPPVTRTRAPVTPPPTPQTPKVHVPPKKDKAKLDGCLSNPSITQAEEKELEEEEESETFVIEDENGPVMDTPKAHVGSNASFAKSLKNCTVPENHLVVQQWLWQLYRFIPGYAADTSMETLLNEVQLKFPHISRTALCRILQFSYPNCPKKRITSRCNLYYFGLVRRPMAAYYSDETVMARVAAHRRGRHLSSDVSDDIKGKTVSILCWEGELECFPPFTQVPKLSPGPRMKPETDFRCRNRKLVPADGDCVPTRTSLRQAIKRQRSSLEDSDKLPEEGASDSEDWHSDPGMGEGADSELNTTPLASHSRMRLPLNRRAEDGIQRIAMRQVAPQEKLLPPNKKLHLMGEQRDPDIPQDVAEPMWSEIRDLIKGQRKGEELWQQVQSVFNGDTDIKTEVSDPYGPDPENSESVGEMAIKEEPVDPGYEDFQGRSTANSAISGNLPVSPNITCSPNSVGRLQAELDHMRSLLDAHQTQLTEQTRENEELKNQLMTANQSLQERDSDLHKLGTQFFCLATQFYCLNGEVQKFAGIFQKVINKSGDGRSPPKS